MTKNKLICIGSIGRSKGLKGEFFLNSFCSPQDNIIKYKDLIKLEDNSSFRIEYIKKLNQKFISKIKNIDNLEYLKKYINLKIYISSNELPKLLPDEVYWHDLKNMKVIDINKKEILGCVQAVNNFGSNDCLIVNPTENSVDKKSRLIPFVKNEIIISVDKENKIIKVNWKSDY